MKPGFYIVKEAAGPYASVAEAEKMARSIVQRNGGEATVMAAVVHLAATVSRECLPVPPPPAEEPPAPMIFADPQPADPALAQRHIESSR